jgi:hypothetical protein
MIQADWERVKWFKPAEFNHPELLKPELIYLLDQEREDLGHPIQRTSDARPGKENQDAGGVKDSLHPAGEAVDVKCLQIHPLDFFLFSCKYPWTEIGLYEIGILHLGYSMNANRRVKRFFGFQCPAMPHLPKDDCPICRGIGKIYKPLSEEILAWYLREKTPKTKNQLLGID